MIDSITSSQVHQETWNISKESSIDGAEKMQQINANVDEHKKELEDMKVVTDVKKDLMSQLKEGSDIQNKKSLLQDCKQRIADWRDYFNALHGDQEAIQRKIKEFGNHKSRRITRSDFFLRLDDLSEEELQEEYMKHFESQTSERYLWWVIQAVLTSASNVWFFSAMNGKEWKIDEDFSKVIRITQKLINVAQKMDKQLLWKNV